jgi:hypothetical protein
VTLPQTNRLGGRITSPSQPELLDLIVLSARYAVASPKAASAYIELLNEFGSVAATPHYDPAALVVDEVLSRLRQIWEAGWQPLDLIHAAKRRASVAASKWLVRAVLFESQRTDAVNRAPQVWVDQLSALGAQATLPDSTESLLPARGTAGVDQWLTALIAMDFLQRLPGAQLLMPPPSQWGQRSQTRVVRPPNSGHSDKTLAKIRALLAKAESTDFAAEAEAFTAKAQDLMTRHSIDEALLADASGERFDVDGLRVLIDNPYAAEKATLLHVVAKANRTRAVWSDFGSYGTLVGAPTDVSQVQMLFTSLLVQATRSMIQAGETSRGADRTSGFRKAFLTSFAIRIGERLVDADAEAAKAYGSALVPVFERQASAVDDELKRSFPNVTTPTAVKSYDARGWDAGAHAANEAVLPAGEVER